MSEKEIIKNNIMIAKFMGIKPCKLWNSDQYCLSNTPLWVVTDSTPKLVMKRSAMLFRYHDSWDKLMPVVNKIENGYFWNHSIVIKNSHCQISNFNDNKWYMANSKIESVYNAVIDFINTKSLQKKYGKSKIQNSKI